jgi:hypothetical protein
MSCDGCLTTNKGNDTSLENIKMQAKLYAKQNQTPVAIYKEGFQWSFIEAHTAIANNYPITEFISQY